MIIHRFPEFKTIRPTLFPSSCFARRALYISYVLQKLRSDFYYDDAKPDLFIEEDGNFFYSTKWYNDHYKY